MQIHHDFHHEADMRAREAEEWAFQRRLRREAEGTKLSRPHRGPWHRLAAFVTHLRRKAKVVYGSAFHGHAHGMHRPHG
jgi:hypothetical protein